MSDYRIRPASHADVEALFQLRLCALQTDPQAFGSDYDSTLRDETATTYAKRIPDATSDNRILVAHTPEDTLVGLAGLVRGSRPKMRHAAHIWGVFVMPAHRGQGLGRQLVRGLLDHAHQLVGLRRVNLSVVTTQTAALHTYRALGFQIWGTEPAALCIDGTDYDEHHMNYWIESP